MTDACNAPFGRVASCAGTSDIVAEFPDVPLAVTVSHGTVAPAVQLIGAPLSDVATVRLIKLSAEVDAASMSKLTGFGVAVSTDALSAYETGIVIAAPVV